MRKIMLENGDWDKQVSIMEMGWTSDQRPESPYAWHAVTEEEKATYLAGAFRYADRNWTPWVAHVSVIYIPDPHWTAAEEQFHWAITNPDGTTRPAYATLQAVLPGLANDDPRAAVRASPSPGASPAAIPGGSPAPSPTTGP
jgi:polysaccharide biosynthesis protein PslG